MLDMPMMDEFFKIFPREFDYVFYGIDIIVDANTGVHYFVDCNYLPDYKNIPTQHLLSAVDDLIED